MSQAASNGFLPANELLHAIYRGDWQRLAVKEAEGLTRSLSDRAVDLLESLLAPTVYVQQFDVVIDKYLHVDDHDATYAVTMDWSPNSRYLLYVRKRLFLLLCYAFVLVSLT